MMPSIKQLVSFLKRQGCTNVKAKAGPDGAYTVTYTTPANDRGRLERMWGPDAFINEFIAGKQVATHWSYSDVRNAWK